MNSDYQRISRAISHLRTHTREQPGLEALARVCGLSPYHLQRLFRRWAGLSPKQFLQYLTVDHARRLLADSTPVLDASFAVGLSSPGRLHDHFVSIDAVTPGDVRRGGDGLLIRWGVVPTPFGHAFIAVTQRGVCAVEFAGDDAASSAVARLREKWPGARFEHDPVSVKNQTSTLFRESGQRQPIRVLVQGTNFQVQVWQALLRIPPGHLCAYGQLATYLERPRATRAVASAVGANPVAWLIPCHRVLRAGGEPGGYRWGLDCKQAMLTWEAGHHPSPPRMRAKNAGPNEFAAPAHDATA